MVVTTLPIHPFGSAASSPSLSSPDVPFWDHSYSKPPTGCNETRQYVSPSQTTKHVFSIDSGMHDNNDTDHTENTADEEKDEDENDDLHLNLSDIEMNVDNSNVYEGEDSIQNFVDSLIASDASFLAEDQHISCSLQSHTNMNNSDKDMTQQHCHIPTKVCSCIDPNSRYFPACVYSNCDKSSSNLCSTTTATFEDKHQSRPNGVKLRPGDYLPPVYINIDDNDILPEKTAPGYDTPQTSPNVFSDETDSTAPTITVNLGFEQDLCCNTCEDITDWFLDGLGSDEYRTKSMSTHSAITQSHSLCKTSQNRTTVESQQNLYINIDEKHQRNPVHPPHHLHKNCFDDHLKHRSVLTGDASPYPHTPNSETTDSTFDDFDIDDFADLANYLSDFPNISSPNEAESKVADVGAQYKIKDGSTCYKLDAQTYSLPPSPPQSPATGNSQSLTIKQTLLGGAKTNDIMMDTSEDLEILDLFSDEASFSFAHLDYFDKQTNAYHCQMN